MKGIYIKVYKFIKVYLNSIFKGDEVKGSGIDCLNQWFLTFIGSTEIQG